MNGCSLQDLRSPLGRAKASGVGSESVVHPIEFYTELKNNCAKL
ncbi:hypothetical protein CP97_14629 [Aurantiacibacter atlanticus]|uniref:Uncharacterized protein n=1 Tax=Aurantiacibacter atlanticus TaxID=1648404 RepID=A0A168LZS9_9SPHN|nr:hypothetical protein CP97_14629 [Aurantiacibacter atlanticus]